MSDYNLSDGNEKVFARVKALKAKYADRDVRSTQVRYVRAGDFDRVAEHLFNEDWPRPTVANLIDTMARDFAASLAPLPTFACSSTSMVSDAARNFADKRTKIANNYVQFSNLAAQNLDGADGYNCYGLYAISVEPDLKAKMPRMRVLDGATVYPLWNSYMETIAAAQIYTLSAPDVEARWPQVGEARRTNQISCQGEQYEVCKYVDSERVVVYLPEAGNMVLEQSRNLLGRCFIVAVPRPAGEGSWSGNIHGAYDDLIWPQMARHQFQMLAMEAAADAVEAPLAVPMDVPDLPHGPKAVIRSNNPQGIRRVPVDVPQQAFQAMQWLERDMQLGGMTTQARMGQQGSGWTTGRGMEALGDSYSGQLAAAQEMLKFALKQALGLCFAWDEKLWANVSKKIRGHDNGVPFEITYTPAKDIKGDHTVDITYGFAAGMDPNRSLVYLLQGLGAGLLSKDYVLRNLPAQVNATEELKKVELEQVRAAALAALNGMSATIPQLAMNGQDPSDAIAKIAEVAKLMQKGDPIEVVLGKVFAPKPPPAPAGTDTGMPAGMPGQPGSPDAGGAPMGGGGAAPQAPQGRPNLQMLMAGLSSSGNPNLSAAVSRMPQAAQ